jgi:HPt (histidine-containing phosphotransfer) domain-containing protein
VRRAALDPATIDELRALGEELGEDVLGEVAAAFERTAPPLLGEIAEALAAQDFARLARSAHTLKSSSAQVGAKRLRDLAIELETAARAGHGEGIEAVAVSCADEIAAVGESLAAFERGVR